MNCIVPCKAGSSFGMWAGWSHTVVLLYCIMAMRLLKEMKPLDLSLSQQAIREFVLYMSIANQHMECIDERMPPDQSSKNICACVCVGGGGDPHDQQQGC